MPLYVAPVQNVFQGLYQADWSISDNTNASYILNKPTNLTQFTNDLAQVDWTMTTTSDPTYILNKPTNLSQFTNDLTSASICTQLAAATLTGTLTTRTGIATAAPLIIPAGALLATPATGVIESDSNALYHSHNTGTNICRTNIDACQFYHTTANSAAITTTLTSVFPNSSAFFKANNFYEVEYMIIFTNTGAFAPTFGWNVTTGNPSTLYGEMRVTPSNTTSATVSTTTFNSAVAKAIAGGNASGTFILRFKGFFIPIGTAVAPAMSVATTGSLTILAGSYYKVYNRGV